MKNRINIIFVALAVVMVVMVAFPYAGLSQKPTSNSVDTEVYERLKVFSSVLNIVDQSYTEEVEISELVDSAIAGMLESLDPHSSYMRPTDYKEMQVDTKGEFGGLGIEIGMRNGVLTVISPIEDTPADKAGLQASDMIVKIEDKPTRDMSLTDAVKLMRGKKGTDITIWVMREGLAEPKSYTITRDTIKIRSVRFEDLGDGIGYVRIAQFQEKTGADLEKALVELGSRDDKIKGLVLDLRNNPGGLLSQAVSVSDKFIGKGVIVSTKGRIGRGSDMEFTASKLGTHPDYPIVVLVNGGSASASEIVSGALQDHGRAIVLGTQTFGKGSVQTIIPLNDGSALRLTTSKYYTPSGRSIQALGITPDIIVGAKSKKFKNISEKDLAGHLEGDDEAKENDKKNNKKAEKDKAEKDETSEEEKPKGLYLIEEIDSERPIREIQLERAVNYLKSYLKFKEVSG